MLDLALDGSRRWTFVIVTDALDGGLLQRDDWTREIRDTDVFGRAVSNCEFWLGCGIVNSMESSIVWFSSEIDDITRVCCVEDSLKCLVGIWVILFDFIRFDDDADDAESWNDVYLGKSLSETCFSRRCQYFLPLKQK